MTAVLVRRWITQGNQRLQTGNSIQALSGFHILRFIDNNDRVGRLDIFNRGYALLTNLVDDVLVFGKGVNVHDQDLHGLTGGEIA